MNLRQFLQSPVSSEPHFLLLGNPVDHSLSPLMHNKAAKVYGMDTRYYAIKLEPNELNSIAAHFNGEAFKGANITIPYKQMLLEYVDELDEVSRTFGAINTIVKRANVLTGYNTDVHGFGVPLQEYSDELEGGRAIVFGTGGASKAIVYALHNLGMSEVCLISRRPETAAGYSDDSGTFVSSYEVWPELSEEACLIVNATPLGMEPDVDRSPVKEDEVLFLAGKICYDIVYKPLQTRFLKQAERVGARTIGGLEMLIQQGSRSFDLWTGKPFPIQEVRESLYENFRK